MMKRLSLILVLLLALAALAMGYFPWRAWIAQELKERLAAKGIEAEFAVESLGLHGLVLRDVRVTQPVPLAFSTLTLNYQGRELLRGQVRELKIGELAFAQDALDTKIKDVTLRFSDAPERSHWQGSWESEAIVISGLAVPLPPLAGTGTFDATPTRLQAEGEFTSTDKNYQASVALNYKDGDPTSSVLIKQASLPWHGGRLSTANARLFLTGPKLLEAVLQVARVPLQDVLQLAVHEQAKATGTISGKVPLKVHRDGRLWVENGALEATPNGTIALDLSTIPSGDNTELQLVGQLLEDFHYQEFTLGLESGKDARLSLQLRLYGNNPAIYGGKMVKLNVQLGGDVLNLLRQSILPMTDAKQLLKAK